MGSGLSELENRLLKGDTWFPVAAESQRRARIAGAIAERQTEDHRAVHGGFERVQLDAVAEVFDSFQNGAKLRRQRVVQADSTARRGGEPGGEKRIPLNEFQDGAQCCAIGIYMC